MPEWSSTDDPSARSLDIYSNKEDISNMDNINIGLNL